MGLSITALRLVTGATMAAHGLSKLTPTVGEGPEEAGEAFEQMGFSPGKYFGMAAGITETAGGTMMVAGLGTPWACAMVSGVMCAAIAKVHAKNGFWSKEGGLEYNLHILAATFAVAGAGGGALALDGLRGKKHSGLGWALFQLALGAGAAAATLALAEQQAAAQSGARSIRPSAGPTEDSLLDLADDAGRQDGDYEATGAEQGAHR